MSKPSRLKKQRHLVEQCLHPDAAGIDVGATEMVVAVPPGRDPQPIRSFGTLNADLHALRDWLLQCRITTVAMESTGVYWMTLFGILREAGLEVQLVNASQVKHCPARKTDVQDAQWLMQLHTAGLLRGSFHPPEDIRRLRGLMRERLTFVRDASRQVQRMQKALTEMNVQLHHVLSDIDGVSGLRMLAAIAGGERDAAALWALRDRRCTTEKTTALKALTAQWDKDILERLTRAHVTWQHLQDQIALIDERINELVSALHCEIDGRLLAPDTAPASRVQGRARRLRKGEMPCDVEAQAIRLYGVDLGAIPGVSTQVLATLLSEVGAADTLRSRFASAKAFASWLGLCPDNRKSGGQVLASKTRRVANRLSAALRLSAQALWQSKTQLGDWCRRMKARLGKAEGITATAHRVARIIYTMVSRQCAYDDSRVFQLTPKAAARRRRSLEKQAHALGLKLIAA